MMVMAGHWVWEQPGAYFGVPIQNFWGWWLTTFTALALYQLVLRWLPGNDETTPPVAWAVLSYAVMGVTTVAMPAAVAARRPLDESSNARQAPAGSCSAVSIC